MLFQQLAARDGLDQKQPAQHTDAMEEKLRPEVLHPHACKFDSNLSAVSRGPADASIGV